VYYLLPFYRGAGIQIWVMHIMSVLQRTNVAREEHYVNAKDVDAPVLQIQALVAMSHACRDQDIMLALIMNNNKI
jgi:hypothetical protein